MKQIYQTWAAVVTGVATLLGLGGCTNQSSSTPATTSSPAASNVSAPKIFTIKIGCAAPLTGDQAQIGIDHCQGVQMAVEEANASGRLGTAKVEILKMDDQHNPAQAVNV